ncbi:MAG: TrkH family potassium uptake protein, partial [Oscillospiraceae bacterium]|nr:TrkH family potassium uptake protein [Oscillospiraceae bacterium]
MNFKIVGRIVGSALLVEALLMVPSLLICLYDGQPHTALACLAAIAVTAGGAALLYYFCRNFDETFYAQEGFLATGLTWVALSVMGCLPFYFSGEIPSFVDAFFETVSGFTTTGASILSNVEAMSRGLLYWRSFTHWVGGMGVLVFVLAVVPKTSGGCAMHLMRAESPGPSVDKLTARLGQTTRILYGLYLALTLVNIFFLLLGGMPLFESVCHALGTAGTGGFGIKNDSFMSYSPYLQNVTTIFMALFGVNFGVYYLLLLRQVNKALADEELRLYLGIMAGSSLLIAWNIHSRYQSWAEAFRHAAFQVSSVMTTTGYAT